MERVQIHVNPATWPKAVGFDVNHEPFAAHRSDRVCDHPRLSGDAEDTLGPVWAYGEDHPRLTLPE